MTLGKSEAKIDGLEKIDGSAVFVDDMQRPGLLHAAFLRSPHAHARILSIDTSKAAAIPGVHAILTGPDLGEAGLHPPVLDVQFHDTVAQGTDPLRGFAVFLVIADSIISMLFPFW